MTAYSNIRTEQGPRDLRPPHHNLRGVRPPLRGSRNRLGPACWCRTGCHESLGLALDCCGARGEELAAVTGVAGTLGAKGIAGQGLLPAERGRERGSCGPPGGSLPGCSVTQCLRLAEGCVRARGEAHGRRLLVGSSTVPMGVEWRSLLRSGPPLPLISCPALEVHCFL
ncbi:hypothetical protein NDU88_002702 [Pleurodeles waltl]|uniref:Uncharacterized protein n=1 Tax=Pleurodeles waltl TaxID=8319 RepID=A0AAV7MQF6_PLEWA|nr:hypothetical protein NDU88_002702 [Pleurodeles waltl]